MKKRTQPVKLRIMADALAEYADVLRFVSDAELRLVLRDAVDALDSDVARRISARVNAQYWLATNQFIESCKLLTRIDKMKAIKSAELLDRVVTESSTEVFGDTQLIKAIVEEARRFFLTGAVDTASRSTIDAFILRDLHYLILIDLSCSITPQTKAAIARRLYRSRNTVREAMEKLEDCLFIQSITEAGKEVGWLLLPLGKEAVEALSREQRDRLR